MKTKTAKWAGMVVVLGLAGTPGLALAGEWFQCGYLSQLVNCQLPSFPVTRHEYGIAYTTVQPQVITCSTLGGGYRIYNRDPYFISETSYNPPFVSMNRGGFIFYTGTSAPDGNDCQSSTWRQRAWRLMPDNTITAWELNGCVNQVIWCRPY